MTEQQATRQRDKAAEAGQRYNAAMKAAWRAFRRKTAPARKEYGAAIAPAYAAWNEAMDVAMDEEAAAVAAVAHLPEDSPVRIAAEEAAHDAFEAARQAANDAYRQAVEPHREAYLRAIAPAMAVLDADLERAERAFEEARRKAAYA